MIPSEICALSYLERVDLSDNSIQGTIPSCLAKSKSLKQVFLNGNRLDGTLPAFLTISTLEMLDVSDNQVTGNLEDLYGGNVNTTFANGMTSLVLSDNLLTGEVPNIFRNLVLLEELRLDGNDFSGEVGESFCALQTDGFLTDFSADCDELTCSCCTECF